MRSQNLGAVTPVSLVAVVLARVMAGGYIDTCHSTQLADSETDFGGRAEALEQVHLNAVGAEDISHTLGKHTSVVTAVVTYHHTLAALRESHVDIIGESLGSHAHNILIHTVGTSTHDAAQTARAEFKALIERVYQRILILVIQHSLDLGLRLIIITG